MTVQSTPLRFYWDTMLGSTGSTFVATSTSTSVGFALTNVFNWLEVNSWKASSSATQNLTFDSGVGNSHDADYVAVMGHNLNTIGATLKLQYSTDNFVGSITTVVDFTPTDDKLFLREFTAPGAQRYWRAIIEGGSTSPAMAICVWGTKSTIAFINPPFDPYGQEIKADMGVSQSGFVTGVHNKFTERQIQISLNEVNSTGFT